jgi:uncharacterized protein (DUF2132 family)
MSKEQPNNPLHGVKLADILAHLVATLGWESMGNSVPIRCFQFDPSIKSSLAFLRKNQWARDKVELLYIETLQSKDSAKSNSTQKAKSGKYAVRK